jgi:2-dehydro-3-deoxyphosphogluconate aldolase/(4S)-4-hydroxy-2-oxoglutarate aldolase
VGAGTVLNAETARDCLDAGAQFVVSPLSIWKQLLSVADAGCAIMPGAHDTD